MKTKSGLIILSIGLLALVYFLPRQMGEKNLDHSQKASFTPSNVLLLNTY